MFARSVAVKTEVDKRMSNERNRRRFPLGTVVRVSGLKIASDLNGYQEQQQQHQPHVCMYRGGTNMILKIFHSAMC